MKKVEIKLNLEMYELVEIENAGGDELHLFELPIDLSTYGLSTMKSYSIKDKHGLLRDEIPVEYNKNSNKLSVAGLYDPVGKEDLRLDDAIILVEGEEST